mmetsp:Transcript_5748/g.19570  ORF Transcript_5748/g.19570 Transcript_5748/m.19570 type:complete len:132 (+) Transcript_5748:355-750(+)
MWMVPRRRACAASWVTQATATPSSSQTRTTACSTAATVAASHEAVGSSRSTARGRRASTRASAARCRSPPERSDQGRSTVPSASPSPPARLRSLGSRSAAAWPLRRWAPKALAASRSAVGLPVTGGMLWGK